MNNRILIGDAQEMLRTLDEESINCCVTSPPYFGLRDYGVDGQIGLEKSVDDYVSRLVSVFREVRRVLCDDGTLWLNLGDSWGGSGKGRNGDGSHGGKCGDKQATSKGAIDGRLGRASGELKQLLGIPWRVAFALQADGWILRQDIIWHKPNPMPESVKDRCVKAHEYLFLFAKQPRYYFETIKEPAVYAGVPRGGSKKRYEQNAAGCDSKLYDTRTKRSVWTIQPAKKKFGEVKHFATFPKALVEPCILASCPVGGVVLDPFAGSGTVGRVAADNGRKYVLIELNSKYLELINDNLGIANNAELLTQQNNQLP